MMVQARQNLDLTQDSMYFVFSNEPAEIGSFKGDLLDRVFRSIHNVTSFEHTAISTFAKLSKSM